MDIFTAILAELLWCRFLEELITQVFLNLLKSWIGRNMSSGKSQAHCVALMKSEKIASSDRFQSPVPGGWRTKGFACHSLQEEGLWQSLPNRSISFCPCGMKSIATSEGAEMSLSVCRDLDVSGPTATAMSPSWLRMARWRSGKGQAAVGRLCRNRLKRIHAVPLNPHSTCL